ncbi:unnamed protein product, partial [Bemisia tabaci]
GLDFVENDATFEHAVTCAEFGKFHYFLLAVCGLIYADLAIGVTIISFVLPSAECDFQLTSQDKGWLNAAPMFGMLLGSYFWGCLADTQGRKVVLVAALLMDGIFGLLSSISQFSSLFMVCRFFNGFGIAGAMGICFPYLGEFQPTEFREKVLSWMELFWTFGIIALPGIAWLIIPLPILFQVPHFKFASWNLFIVVCSIPSLILAVWLCFFPESPKFLLECGEHEKALDVLRHVFSVNTGVPPDEFPVANLKERAPRVSIISIQSKRSVRSVKSVKSPKDVKLLLREVGYQTLELFYPPYRKNTILACLIQFGITSSYYTLMLWFPELFNRFDHYEREHPHSPSVSVCEVSSVYVSSNSSHTINAIEHCTETIDSSVFSHTLIIGLACIPTSLWLPLCVHKLGAKFFLVFCMLVSGGVTVGLYFVQTSNQNLLLSCIFEALTSLGISVVYCIMVDLFPTNLRVMAAALSATIGRVGALLGNLVFGFLIDTFCVVPIMLMAALLFMSGILAMFLPATGKEDLD